MSVENEQSIKDTFGRGFDAALGLRLTDVTADLVAGTVEMLEQHHQPFGIVHGGVYCALAEGAASIGGFTWLQSSGIGGTAVGVNNNTDFLRSISTGAVSVEATPVHRGRRQQLWRVTMTDGDGRLVATSQVRLQNIELPEGVTVPGVTTGA